MKKKLSYLLALVFILTLVLGTFVIPNAKAAISSFTTSNGTFTLSELQRKNVSSGKYTTDTYGTANLIVFKQGNFFVVWADSTVTDTDANIIAAAVAFDPSLKNKGGPITGAVTRLNSFNMKTVLESYNSITINNNSVDVDVVIDTGHKTFTCSKSVSHINLMQFDPPVVTGTLTVNKAVSGISTSEAFSIDVTFKNPNGLEGLIQTGDDPSTACIASDTSKTYSISLADGDSAQFTGIPLNTTYTVDETASLSSNWSVSGEVTADDEAAITSENKDVTIEITNHYESSNDYETATLTVDKSVLSGSRDQPFTITVVFSGSGLSSIKNDKDLEGSYSSPMSIMETDSNPYFETLTFTFPLSDNNGIVTFSDIPFGTGYTVNESASLPADWYYVSGNTGQEPIELNDDNPSDNVTITNRYNPPEYPINYGTLSVTKAVTGADISTSEEFEFTVTFTPGSSGIVAPAGATGGSGTYTIYLSADDGTVTFSNIPVGTDYMVTETISPGQEADGWKIHSQDATSGTIAISGSAAVVTNTVAGVAGASDNSGNTEEPEAGVADDVDTLPKTGGIASSTLLMFLGLTLVAIGGTALLIMRKKRAGDNKSKQTPPPHCDTIK